MINDDKEVRDLTQEDLGQTGMFQGEKIALNDILNEPIIIRSFDTRPSKFHEGEYAIIQIEYQDKPCVIMTSSAVLLDGIKKVADRLPLRCRITKGKGQKGHRYYAIAPAIIKI